MKVDENGYNFVEDKDKWTDALLAIKDNADLLYEMMKKAGVIDKARQNEITGTYKEE